MTNYSGLRQQQKKELKQEWRQPQVYDKGDEVVFWWTFNVWLCFFLEW
jgi:hypothetical protein